MKKSVLCGILLLCFCAGLTAQYIYNPSNSPTAGSANSWPFNSDTEWRYQFIIDSKVLGNAPLKIVDIAFAPGSTRVWDSSRRP